MIKAIWHYHKLLSMIALISFMSAIVCFILYAFVIIEAGSGYKSLSVFLEVMMNISISIFIAIIIFIITSFLPNYIATIRGLKSHLNIIKELRALLYLFLEPLARKYGISNESSLNVFVNESDLYDLNLIKEKTKKYNVLLNFEIDQFIRKQNNPMKFYDDTNTTLKNIEYMKRILDSFDSKLDIFHIYCNRSLYYNEASQILIEIKENSFLKTIDPKSKVENSIHSENLPELIDWIFKLNKLISRLERNVKAKV